MGRVGGGDSGYGVTGVTGVTGSRALARLRGHVVRRAFGAPAPLAAAMARLGFVQADPLRAPARAQDLILRHRVRGYRAGDLERAYPRLGLDEDYLYAYGFVTPAVRHLLHPGGGEAPAGLAAEVLALVRARGHAHPRDVAAAFGRATERNAWGGQSLATTRALEALHARGLVRVARRERGVRVYAPAVDLPPAPPDPDARVRALVALLLGLFAPLPEAGLRRALRHVPFVRRTLPTPAVRRLLAAMHADRTLDGADLLGERWVWPPGDAPEGPAPAPPRVRLLAPFDPLVWDRDRFARLWGWEYRFEAYTPAARRERGHYALPLLWGADVVGWATVAAGGGGGGERGGDPGALDVALGFARGRPAGAAFARGLEAEVERLRAFLRPRPR